jgi:hypothetical protein
MTTGPGPGEVWGTWDLNCAAEWGRDTDRLSDLLIYLGVSAEPVKEQQKRLAHWTHEAPYIPAPAVLKDKIRDFLRTGKLPADELNRGP